MKKTASILVLILYCAVHFGVAQKRPNVLLIITDDQGWGDVSFHGNQQIETPVLDDLAKKSVQFNRFYVSPVCAPTRASVLTGKYHLNTGVSWVTNRKEVLRSREHTLAELFGEQGYSTGLFGKWHNGMQYPHDPIGQGFSTFFGFSEGHLNNYYNPEVRSQFKKVATKGYFPDVMTQKAIEFIGSASKPFFCYVSFNTPHGPFQVSDILFEKYTQKGLDPKTASVYGMVENLDKNIGKLLNALEVQEKLDNTIILFMTDNGPNGIRYNGGFKGKKAEVDEGGVRVPFLLRWDKVKWPKSTIDAMAAHIDIYPTLASLCGIGISDKTQIDGIDLSPLLVNAQPSLPDRFIYTHQVVRDIDTVPGAVRTNRFLLTLKNTGPSLYDLEKDPYQNRDIRAKYPAIVDSLMKAYQSWFAESGIVSQSMVPIQIGHPNIANIEFPAPDVLSYSNTRFKGGFGWAHDYFVDFKKESELKWKISTTRRSRYEVLAEIATNGEVPVVFKIKNGKDSLTIGLDKKYIAKRIPSPDRYPRGGVYEWKWQKVRLGTLSFRPEDKELILNIISGDAAGLRLKSIQLEQILLTN